MPVTPGSPAGPSDSLHASRAAASAVPDIRIETFAPERGYIVGAENVVLLCVVRNQSPASLPADMLRLRCYPVSGLDYTSGNLLPTLPTLAPGQAVAYRWRFAPSDAKNALVAGVVLENASERRTTKGESAAAPQAAPRQNGAAPLSGTPVPPVPAGANEASDIDSANPFSAFPPQLAFAVTPRLGRAPGLGDMPPYKDPLPHALERDAGGLLLNNHVGVRILVSERRDPMLLLAAKEGLSWRVVASSLPLLRASAGEDGQQAWWQTFRCQQVRAREDKDSAVLTLTGNLGQSCRAEITLEARPDTCIISGRARLTALRPLRLSGLQLPALMTGNGDKSVEPPRSDGSPVLLTETPSPLPDDVRAAAGHTGATTFGITWPADPPLSGWKWNRLPAGDGTYTQNLGIQALTDIRGDLIGAGASVEFAFRLFAFAPSDTVRDAVRFQYP